ncbi:GNAT family N-acetyltransferase [Streptantibioticus parmotrematis]|uniref:GNAT family N-acetyltransferase n=1 Tax=Streptantibioticus parmotrematis TaxID=2873249 RepID=UPI0033F7616B
MTKEAAEATRAAGATAGTRFEVLEPERWEEWYGALERAFGGPPEAPEERALWHGLTECDRSLVALDGDVIAGGASAFSFRLSLPGGAVVPAAGVTMVGVTPTHRRRGVLTSLMRRQLDDVRERGESLAVLTASEPAIYGRFGYGAATRKLRIDAETRRVSPVGPQGTDDVRLRLADPREALGACEAVYAALVPRRPGMLARRPGWEELPLLDPQRDREGFGERLCVLAERDGRVTGYARYATRLTQSRGGQDGTVNVADVEALDAASYAALWRYLFALDLVSTLTCRDRPVDDPLLHLVPDIRRLRLGVVDSLHLRLVDLGAALSARAYAAPVDVVLEVADPFCPWNAGRWRLTGDAKGAVCERTTDAAELSLPTGALATAYLGGPSLASLAGAGRVVEERAGALAAASLAFGAGVAPWLPHGF